MPLYSEAGELCKNHEKTLQPCVNKKVFNQRPFHCRCLHNNHDWARKDRCGSGWLTLMRGFTGTDEPHFKSGKLQMLVGRRRVRWHYSWWLEGAARAEIYPVIGKWNTGVGQNPNEFATSCSLSFFFLIKSNLRVKVLLRALKIKGLLGTTTSPFPPTAVERIGWMI